MRHILMEGAYIRPPLTYAPSPDAYSATNFNGRPVSFTITASQPVVWNWSARGNLPSSSVANGGTASSITFTLNNSGAPQKEAFVSVTSNGNTWSIDLLSETSGA